jgi:hypothetical protein
LAGLNVEQTLSDDLVHQFVVVENWLAARIVIPRKTECGQDLVTDMEITFGQRC